MTDFSGRTALVTGAASGIGAAVAKKLFALGANVIIADQDASVGELALKIDPTGLRLVGCQADITKISDIARAISLADAFGGLDLAINSAGIGQSAVPATELAEEEWLRVIEINLTGLFLSLRHEVRAIQSTGRGGAIVNLASALGIKGAACGAAYVASKHGVIGLTKSVALDCAAHKIRVNAVAPGIVVTPLTQGGLTEDAKWALLQRHPVERFGNADEVADLILFLLSDKATFITGSVQSIDGGWTAH